MVSHTEWAEYAQQGFLIKRQLINAATVIQIRQQAMQIFARQCAFRLGYAAARLTQAIESEQFAPYMFELFNVDRQRFIYCGKQAQHLITLHQLSLSQPILQTLQALRLDFANISTRPVLFFNHPRLAEKTVYYKVFAHQDWRSMQGSLDAIIVWIPLLDIGAELGPLEIIPRSHRQGLLAQQMEDGFGKVEGVCDQQFEAVPLQAGDALFFSSFLVHRSGENVSDGIRWSCHFRYNNLNEATFIQRGFPHPYRYYPEPTLLTPQFPEVTQVNDVYQDKG